MFFSGDSAGITGDSHTCTVDGDFDFNAPPGFSSTINLSLGGFCCFEWNGTGDTPNTTDTYTAAVSSSASANSVGCLWHSDNASNCQGSVHSINGSGASQGGSTMYVTVSWHYGHCPNPNDPNDDGLQHCYIITPVDSEVYASASGGATSYDPPSPGELQVSGSLHFIAITSNGSATPPPSE